jgi:tetratricopeptide (TPR) repeat protein
MENSTKANELRKSGDIDSALPIYKELWETSKDKFAAAGLLFCLRKKKKFSEALPLAQEAYLTFPGFEWCKNEYIWTLIQGKLYTFPEDGELSELITTVNRIIDLKPDEIAYKTTIFKLLKYAKKKGDWNLINEWIIKLQPEVLNGYTDQEVGWNDKALWYYYRVNGLIYSRKEKEAIKILIECCDEFYKQKKHFQRLKAKAYIGLDKIDDAIGIYRSIVQNKPDWWLLHEYASLLIKQNNIKEGFNNLIKAAISPPMKPELKVTLFYEIGSTLIQMNNTEHAILHFKLVKSIREEQGWGLGDINVKIKNLGGDINENNDVKSLFNLCQKLWHGYMPMFSSNSESKNKMQGLIGKVTSLIDGRPFCFIRTQSNESYFCSTSDLPKGTITNQLVRFDIKPSFNKKKNEETFKAINITRWN